MRRISIWVVMAMMMTAWACSGEEEKAKLSKTELVNYINKESRGLVQEKEVAGIHARLAYQPGSMMVAQELDGEQWNDTALVRTTEEKYKDSYYFILKFSKNGKEVIRQLGDFGRYSDMVQVFSFGMNRFVNLTTPQKDTVALGDFFFDQTYGMGDGNNILLSFDKKRLANASDIDINIAECGLGIGNLKFSFNKASLDKVPALDYSKL